MKRKALLKDGDEFVVLEESEFDAETELQEALKRNPEAIPVADLELSEVVVVGRETSLPAGSIDLLLVDAEGQVIVVETKLSRNPELRRQVVAQVLDYGASLWRTARTLKEFEALVLRYWRSDACEDVRVKEARTLREGLEPIFQEQGEEWAYEAFEAALEENLANGQHVLLVVASGLMDGLSRDLLQYANVCLSIPLYGVEIDVFETKTRQQLIVPRGVRYTARPRPKPSPGRTDRTTFLGECTPPAAEFFGHMLDDAERHGATVYWGSKGFSVRMLIGERPVTVMYGFPPCRFQVYTGQWTTVDADCRAEFHRRLQEIAPFDLGGEFTNTLLLSEKTQSQAYAALEFMWGEVEKMVEAAREEA